MKPYDLIMIGGGLAGMSGARLVPFDFGTQSGGLSHRRASWKSAHPRCSGKAGATVSTEKKLIKNNPQNENQC